MTMRNSSSGTVIKIGINIIILSSFLIEYLPSGSVVQKLGKILGNIKLYLDFFFGFLLIQNLGLSATRMAASNTIGNSYNGRSRSYED